MRYWIDGDHIRVLGAVRGPTAACPLNFLGGEFASAQPSEHSVFSFCAHTISFRGFWVTVRPKLFIFRFCDGYLQASTLEGDRAAIGSA